MNFDLSFGHSGLQLTLPDSLGTTVIRKPSIPVTESGADIIDAALASPIATERLETLAKGAGTACILICDITLSLIHI